MSGGLPPQAAAHASQPLPNAKVNKPRKSDRDVNAEVEALRAALRPFAAEGRKWVGTAPVFDDLKLLVAEDYPLLAYPARVADFTIGDLKRAVAAYDAG